MAPKAEKSHVNGVIFTSLALHLSMLIVGAQYNSEEHCKLEAPMYLMVAGGIITTLNILTLIASLTPCDQDDKIVAGLSPLVALAMFAVTIWGSVVVFGPYSEWVSDNGSVWSYKNASSDNGSVVVFGPDSEWRYENEFSDYYCEYTPFMFAFVMLILEWILIPVLVLLACCLLCLTGTD